MLTCFSTEKKSAIPVHVVSIDEYDSWLVKQSEHFKNWLQSTQFRTEAGNIRIIPNTTGQIEAVLCCVADKTNPWCIGHLPQALPEGIYDITNDKDYAELYAISWGLGAYQFTRYKKPSRIAAKLYLQKEFTASVKNIVEAIYLVRDLINTPADDMGPSQLAMAAQKLAKESDAQFSQIVGEELLEQNYACIYTVGRASDDAPRLLDMRWGDENHPKITLVGKGVCFDTGGLDIKASNYMLLMKKDMAGAANVLGLARMIMQAQLPIRLRVLIPAVENSVSGNSYRPGDIIKSRKGLTIEIGNTDAEGRLVLADALTEAASENPELIIDLSTLTGAARVALGTDLAAVFANNDKVVNQVIAEGNRLHDMIWRLPLFGMYRESLNSNIADINNCSMESYAGAITAALFLKEFVPDNIPWLHFDMMAWNLSTRPGRPQGGEAMAIRALFSYLKNVYNS